MKIKTVLALVAFVTVFSACAPTAITQPEEIRVPVGFDEAFDVVSTTINTQPYPSCKGGWVITNSDQVGGLILAEMTYRTIDCNWFFGNSVPVTERVSVALNELSDDMTAVNVSLSSGSEAQALANAVVEALGDL